jgi:hypothetical protein
MMWARHHEDVIGVHGTGRPPPLQAAGMEGVAVRDSRPMEEVTTNEVGVLDGHPELQLAM